VISGQVALEARTASVEPPQVVVIGPLPPPFHGGAVATSLVLRSGLTSACHILHLDTTDRRGLDNIGRFEIGNVVLALSHCARLLRLLAMERPAAVYVPLAQNTLGLLRDATFVLPTLLWRRRLIIHLHGSGFRDFYEAAGRPLKMLLRRMLGGADRVIVLGECLRPTLAGLVDADRIAVLPNGIEDEFGTTPTRGPHEGPVRVLFLANLMRAKGFVEAMEAVASLRSRGVNVQLHMAGGFLTDSDRAEATARAAALGDGVIMHGVIAGAEKLALLRGADIFLFPSHSEGHPYVVLEAMSAGLPVVTTTLPTLIETVEHGRTGLLVSPRDTVALADAVGALAADHAMRIRLGHAGRQRFEERYDFDVWSARLTSIISQTVRA
jgi:glycosyltransferase involved in cell wall biosynthesis